MEGPCADSEEKHEPVSGVDIAVAVSLKVLDLDGRLEKRTSAGLCSTSPFDPERIWPGLTFGLSKCAILRFRMPCAGLGRNENRRQSGRKSCERATPQGRFAEAPKGADIPSPQFDQCW